MNLHIYLINIQGLTEPKILEIQEFTNHDSLVCLTETQQKIDKFNIKNDIEKYVAMRKKESKKGGGLMILKKRGSEIQVEDVFTLHEDCMGLNCSFHGFKFLLLNVYYKSNDNNTDINQKIDRFLQKNEDVATILVGDFNAHTGQLGEPYNKNGRLLMDLAERNNLTILNGTIECEGKVTWEGRGHKSAIDYALVNQRMLEKYSHMKIDEDREMTDISDHCMLKVVLSLKTDKTRQKQDNVVTNCLTEERLRDFVENVEGKLREMEDSDVNMDKIDCAMKEAAETHIRKVNKKSGRGKEKGRYETIWMTREIKKEIDLRKRLNRLKRNNLDPDIETRFNKKYQEQKQKVKEIVREEVHKHEQKVTDEIKKDKNGKLWENINYLRGKSKNKKTGVGIYDENGTVIEEDKIRENLTTYWKEIYRKAENNIEEIWIGTRDQYTAELDNNSVEVNGYRFPSSVQEHMEYAIEIRPEERHKNPMDTPKITSTQLKNQIKKMKNKKAPGNNKLPAELYKEIAKNEVCLEKMTTAMNNTITKKDIPEEWSRSTTKLIPKTKNQELRTLGRGYIKRAKFIGAKVHRSESAS